MRPKTKLKKVKSKITATKIQKCIMTKRSLSLTQFPARPRKRPKVVRINPIGEQKKLNRETFGVSGNNRRGYYRRGGQNGGPRGGGGYNNYNNRGGGGGYNNYMNGGRGGYSNQGFNSRFARDGNNSRGGGRGRGWG